MFLELQLLVRCRLILDLSFVRAIIIMIAVAPINRVGICVFGRLVIASAVKS